MKLFSFMNDRVMAFFNGSFSNISLRYLKTVEDAERVFEEKYSESKSRECLVSPFGGVSLTFTKPIIHSSLDVAFRAKTITHWVLKLLTAK